MKSASLLEVRCLDSLFGSSDLNLVVVSGTLYVWGNCEFGTAGIGRRVGVIDKPFKVQTDVKFKYFLPNPSSPLSSDLSADKLQ